MSDLKPLFQGEVIFLRPSYSDSKGAATITLQVGDMPSDLDIFVGHNNKRYMMALVEIGNDEQPTATLPYKKEKERLGPLCEWAVKRCKEHKFWDYLEEHNDIPSLESELEASNCLKKMYGINSRKELDSPRTAPLFKALIKQYGAWLQHQEVAA